jgi:hypothetical protein
MRFVIAEEIDHALESRDPDDPEALRFIAP